MKKSGQGTVEMILLVVVIMGAIIGMNAYLRRGLQGNIRSSAEQLSGGGLYSPRAVTNGIMETNKEITERGKSYSEDGATGESFKKYMSDMTTTFNTTYSRQENLTPLESEPEREPND